MNIEIDIENFWKKLWDNEYYLGKQTDNNDDTHYVSLIIVDDKWILESRNINPFTS